MKYKGPIFTLVAGVLVAAVLMVLNLAATKNNDGADDVGNVADTTNTATAEPTTAPPTAAPLTTAPATAPPPTATQPPAQGTQVTYAGKAGNGAATIAIAVKDGKAIAYLCDGKNAEAWLQGTATNGTLSLKGEGNASLTGTYGNGVASGNVTATGKQWPFSAKTVKPPSGLYRATANVRGAQVVGGWIVQADGTQVGITKVNGVAQTAAPLNTTTNTSTVNGAPITATVIDGSTL